MKQAVDFIDGLRMRLGAWLIRRGIAVLPDGDSRRELGCVYRSWWNHKIAGWELQ